MRRWVQGVMVGIGGLSTSACIPNPAWDGCVGGDPCPGGRYCEASSGECVRTPELPGELADLPLAQWTPVGTNVAAAADPCPAQDCVYSGNVGARIVAGGWQGGVYADAQGPYGGLVLWGSGSSDYHGNEVYFFDLATLTWSRLSDPTVGRTPGNPDTFEPDPETCTWFDGAPIPVETVGNVVYASKHNAFVVPTAASSGGGGPRPDSGCSTGRGFAFDLGRGEWSLLGDTVDDFASHNPAAYDAERDVIWTWFGNGSLGSYDFATETWTLSQSSGQPGSEAVATLIPELDLLAVANFSGGGGLRVRSVDNPWADAVSIATTGDTEIEQAVDPGFAWASSLGAIVAWDAGGPLYFLRPPAGDWASEPWVWERFEVAGTPPPEPEIGPYGRFQVVDSLGLALVTTRFNEPVFAVRYR